MKKVLILGSDYSTVRVALEAKKSGIYVIVADLMEKSPTKSVADEAWLISTTDIDTLEQKCIKANVNGIMFGASDFNINNARILCKRLGLPIYCDNDFAWEVARNKRLFKDICKKVGAPVASDYHLTDDLNKEDLAQVTFPVVVKPCDKSGNRGMSYCNNQLELVRGYRKAREISDKTIVVERRLFGNEYNVHYVLANGEAKLLYFSSTHHEPGQCENLYSFKNTTSEHLQQYIKEVNDAAKRVIQESGCKEGIVWFDCIHDADGHFYLLEMGYRFGGVMTYIPYSKVIGFNTIKWMLECAMGVKHTAEDMPLELSVALEGCAASYHLFSTHAGRISRIEGLEILDNLDNVFIDMPKREGDTLRADTCSGLVGIYGRNIEEVCETLRIINSNLRILDKAGNNMFIYFDDYESLRKEYYSGLKEFRE